jgi:hypothetical protein
LADAEYLSTLDSVSNQKKENHCGRTISEKPINGRKNVGRSSTVNVSGDTTKENNRPH